MHSPRVKVEVRVSYRLGWGMMSFGLVKFEVAACDDIEQIFMCSGKRLSLEVTIRANMFLWPLSHSRSTLGEHLTLSLDWTHSQNWFIQDPILSWANQDPFLEIWDWDQDITAQSSWSLQWKRCKLSLHKGKWNRHKEKENKIGKRNKKATCFESLIPGVPEAQLHYCLGSLNMFYIFMRVQVRFLIFATPNQSQEATCRW